MSTVSCETCGGSGRVPVQHARWIGGTRNGYQSRWTTEVTCETCSGQDVVAPNLLDVPELANYRRDEVGGVVTISYEHRAPSETMWQTFSVAYVICEACGAKVDETDAIPTIDGEAWVCLSCAEREQEEILADTPELRWFSPYEYTGPDVA